IESALSIMVAGLFGYWHALYAWVIGLSVVTAVFFLASHRELLPIAWHNGDRCAAVDAFRDHGDFYVDQRFLSRCSLCRVFSRIVAALRIMEARSKSKLR